MIQTVLFDFDGTLFDTGEGILRSVQYALEGFGIHETDTARLRKFVGPPLLDSFSELYAMQPAQARAATERYRERYQPIGVYECEIYPGIPELLKQLRAAGFRIAVATGKPTPLARTILQRFDMEQLFDCPSACCTGTRHKSKTPCGNQVFPQGVFCSISGHRFSEHAQRQRVRDLQIGIGRVE